MGKALDFDGINDYVGIMSSSGLTITGNSLSIELWAKPTTTVDSNTGLVNILDKGDEYGFQINPGDGRIRFFVLLSGANWQGVASTTSTWETNTWYFVAATYDGNQICIYVNGVLQNSRSLSGNLYASGSYPLAIGSYCMGTQSSFKGTIDEVNIYNCARTPQQITDDYNGAL
jgi:hypothetical protein